MILLNFYKVTIPMKHLILYDFCFSLYVESRLYFRRNFEDDFYYEQNDDDGVMKAYGLQNDDPTVQDIGSVMALDGRCIAFPNIYQHRVGPLQLVDPTKGGIRRILVFFLIDPDISIKSTATVPPQQLELLSEYLMTLSKFPKEICTNIVEFVPGVYNRATAEVYRKKLMEERKFISDSVTEEMFERPFSLCEH